MASDMTTSRKTLSTDILNRIKEMLWTGLLMPGEHLSLRTTAESLGVSVMPVRQAIAQLVADYALEVAPNKSVRVPLLSQEVFAEITKIRLQLEGMAAEAAAQHADENLIRKITRINDQLAKEMASSGQNKSALVLLNQKFHFVIYEAAQMPVLLKLIESLWLRIGPVLNYDLRQGSQRTTDKIAVIHHENLIKALRAHDGKAAIAALHGDILSSFEYISKEKPSLFQPEQININV